MRGLQPHLAQDGLTGTVFACLTWPLHARRADLSERLGIRAEQFRGGRWAATVQRLEPAKIAAVAALGRLLTDHR
jgi:hypothetical protein